MNILLKGIQVSVSIIIILILFIQCVPAKSGTTDNNTIDTSNPIVEVVDTVENDTSKIVAETIKEYTTNLEETTSILDTTTNNETITPKDTNLELKPKDTLISTSDKFLDIVDLNIKKQGHYGCTRNYKGVKYDVFFLDLRQANLAIHWKDNLGQAYTNIRNLKKDLEKNKKQMLFATNGGIYSTSNTPEGLYIEKGIELEPLNTRDGYGNFYMKPNGVFYLANDKTNKNQIAGIVKTEDFNTTKTNLSKNGYNIVYAVQSGPTLSIKGEKHHKFNEGSSSKRIRNGVGINNNKRVVFAIPQTPVNFFDFYSFFNEILKCENALYLDGVISRMYIESSNSDRKNLDGNFVTIFSVTKK